MSAEAVGRHCKRQLFALAVGVRFGDDFGGVVVRQACWQGASSGNVKSKREKKEGNEKSLNWRLSAGTGSNRFRSQFDGPADLTLLTEARHVQSEFVYV